MRILPVLLVMTFNFKEWSILPDLCFVEGVRLKYKTHIKLDVLFLTFKLVWVGWFI